MSNLSNLQPIKVELSGTYRPDNRVHQNENSSVQIFFNRMDFKGAFRDSTFPSRRSQPPRSFFQRIITFVRSIFRRSTHDLETERGGKSRERRRRRKILAGEAWQSVAKRVLRRASYFYIIEDRLARV